MLLKQLISSLNNAVRQRKKHVSLNLPSKNSLKIINFVNILENNGYIEYWTISNTNKLILQLKYDAYGYSSFKRINIASKSGQPLFTKAKTLWKNASPNVTIILNTSKGLLSSDEARLSNVGGQVFCIIN